MAPQDGEGASRVALIAGPAAFALASLATGTATGFAVGGLQALLAGRGQEAPFPRILQTVRLFGAASLAHGLAGAALIAARGQDDICNRAVAGCAAGLTIAAYQRGLRPTTVCGLCVALAAASMLDVTISSSFREACNEAPPSGQTIHKVSL